MARAWSHILLVFPDRGVDRITRAAYRNGAMPHAPIVLKGPGRFKDPANLTWERYIALQTRERERYLAERATIPQDALDFKSVNPRYLERAIEQFANNYFPEQSATRYIATAAANPGAFAVLADGAEARGDLLSAVNHRARVRDETRHISYARALVKALIEDDPGNLDVIQRWQDESLRLFVEVAKGGERREWWEGFLASYYKIALPLGLRPTTLSF